MPGRIQARRCDIGGAIDGRTDRGIDDRDCN